MSCLRPRRASRSACSCLPREAACARPCATWSAVTPGSHRLTAVGTDEHGALWVSEPVWIAVARTLVPTGSVWKYLDNGSDQGTAWIAPGFDDSAWAAGPAELLGQGR